MEFSPDYGDTTVAECITECDIEFLDQEGYYEEARFEDNTTRKHWNLRKPLNKVAYQSQSL